MVSTCTSFLTISVCAFSIYGSGLFSLLAGIISFSLRVVRNLTYVLDQSIQSFIDWDCLVQSGPAENQLFLSTFSCI
jgi:hypothetical protein